MRCDWTVLFNPDVKFRQDEDGTMWRLSNGEWRRLCEHFRQQASCRECGGSRFCKHNKVRNRCKTCGGSSICEHKRIRYGCKDCNGKGVCEHRLVRSVCKKCNGTAWCEHGHLRHYCKNCIGLCPRCKLRLIKKDGVCEACHPDHIPTNRGVSRIGCDWIDQLEQELGVRIQHSHYDQATKQLIRGEYRSPALPTSPVDGWEATTNTIYEFLGDEYHGHPRLRLRRQHNLYGFSYVDLYTKTERKLQTLFSAGHVLIYIWESEYKQWKRSQTNNLLSSVCRTFDGTLRWET
jgi:hypothetical protein